MAVSKKCAQSVTYNGDYSYKQKATNWAIKAFSSRQFLTKQQKKTVINSDIPEYQI